MANFISKSITIKWGDSDHKIAVTNELCHDLESSGINLFNMQIDLNSGKQPKMFLLGNLITQLLRSVNVPVMQDEVMAKLTKEPADSIALYRFGVAFIAMVFPTVDESELGKSQPETAQK
jgi:hypothetical protein